MIVMALAGFAVACSREPTGPFEPAATPAPTPSTFNPTAQQDPYADQHTPFQRSLMQSIAERRARGLPVPDSVSYSIVRRAAEPEGIALRQAPGAESGTTLEATTTVRFTHAAQAGFGQWPALVVRGAVPRNGTGFVHEGDYTDDVRRQIAERYPNANVDFDTGPRTYTITETMTDRNAPAPGSLLDLTNQGLLSMPSAGLLMGFTVPGPNLDYHIEYNLSVCVVWVFGCWVEWEIVDFWAGFQLDWTIATRLPMTVTLTSPDPVEEGSTFTPTSAAAGLDWSAEDYATAGVPELDGNEYDMEFIFKTGVFLTVSYIPVVDVGVDVNVGGVSSFTTPLGPGAMFSLPPLDISIWNLDVALAEADFGVRLTPQAGSDRFTADWAATGNGSGSGNVTYTTAGQNVTLGAIHAVDGPGNASVGLDNFRYHFTQFGLDLGLYFSLWVAGWDHTWTIPITQFDLSSVTGGLYVGTHSGTPGAVSLLVPITNVAPTALISRAGALMLGGQPTFLTHDGGTLTFTGEAADPGRDDLTLAWDWDDGAPSPDVSTTYPTPYHVSENQTHRFSGACLYQVALRVEDDDQAVGQDRVPVIVAGPAGNLARLDGYWQHQLARVGARDFDDATLDCYLAVAAHMSGVLGEVRDISSIARAYDVLFPRQNGGSPLEQFDRALLVAWLNFAHGAIGYTQLVDTNGDRIPDTPFADALAAAEAARLSPETAPGQIRRLTAMLHQISVAAVT